MSASPKSLSVAAGARFIPVWSDLNLDPNTLPGCILATFSRAMSGIPAAASDIVRILLRHVDQLKSALEAARAMVFLPIVTQDVCNEETTKLLGRKLGNRIRIFQCAFNKTDYIGYMTRLFAEIADPDYLPLVVLGDAPYRKLQYCINLARGLDADEALRNPVTPLTVDMTPHVAAIQALKSDLVAFWSTVGAPYEKTSDEDAPSAAAGGGGDEMEDDDDKPINPVAAAAATADGDASSEDVVMAPPPPPPVKAPSDLTGSSTVSKKSKAVPMPPVVAGGGGGGPSEPVVDVAARPPELGFSFTSLHASEVAHGSKLETSIATKDASAFPSLTALMAHLLHKDVAAFLMTNEGLPYAEDVNKFENALGQVLEFVLKWRQFLRESKMTHSPSDGLPVSAAAITTLLAAASEYGLPVPLELRGRSGRGGSLPDDFPTEMRDLVENSSLSIDPGTFVRGISRLPCFAGIITLLGSAKMFDEDLSTKIHMQMFQVRKWLQTLQFPKLERTAEVGGGAVDQVSRALDELHESCLEAARTRSASAMLSLVLADTKEVLKRVKTTGPGKRGGGVKRGGGGGGGGGGGAASSNNLGMMETEKMQDRFFECFCKSSAHLVEQLGMLRTKRSDPEPAVAPGTYSLKQVYYSLLVVFPSEMASAVKELSDASVEGRLIQLLKKNHTWTHEDLNSLKIIGRIAAHVNDSRNDKLPGAMREIHIYMATGLLRIFLSYVGISKMTWEKFISMIEPDNRDASKIKAFKDVYAYANKISKDFIEHSELFLLAGSQLPTIKVVLGTTLKGQDKEAYFGRVRASTALAEIHFRPAVVKILDVVSSGGRKKGTPGAAATKGSGKSTKGETQVFKRHVVPELAPDGTDMLDDESESGGEGSDSESNDSSSGDEVPSAAKTPGKRPVAEIKKKFAATLHGVDEGGDSYSESEPRPKKRAKQADSGDVGRAGGAPAAEDD